MLLLCLFGIRNLASTTYESILDLEWTSLLESQFYIDLRAEIERLASIRSGDDGKKLIALEFIDTATVVLILEYSYLNFGHYSLSPTDSLYLNIQIVLDTKSCRCND